MLFTQPCRAAEVDQTGSFGIERPGALAREAVMDVTDRVPIRPALPEPVTLHHPHQKADVVIAVHHNAVHARIIRVGPAIFDIPGFIAELLESQEVMHCLPGNAGKRHLAGEMKYDDLAAFAHDQFHLEGKVER